MTLSRNRKGYWGPMVLICAALGLADSASPQAPASDTPPESTPATAPEGEASTPPAETVAEPAPATDPAPETTTEPVPERVTPPRPKPAAARPAPPKPAIVPIAPPAAVQAAPAPDTGLNPQELLTAHNELRARHAAPALSWSAALQQEAQAWADRCQFQHSATANGENLSWWTGPESAGQRMQGWYNEIADYDFARGVSRNGKVVGHFTQIAWQGTSALGCGMAACDGGRMLVCQYTPAGNVQGQYQANVQAAAP